VLDLRCGDCLEILKDIPDKSIDLVIIDPPYEKKNAAFIKVEVLLVLLKESIIQS
jgi:DNA modification methylase